MVHTERVGGVVAAIAALEGAAASARSRSSREPSCEAAVRHETCGDDEASCNMETLEVGVARGTPVTH